MKRIKGLPTKRNRKEINYDDDIVFVFNPDGELVYKGEWDYYKSDEFYDNAKWDRENKYYTCDGYIILSLV